MKWAASSPSDAAAANVGEPLPKAIGNVDDHVPRSVPGLARALSGTTTCLAPTCGWANPVPRALPTGPFATHDAVRLVVATPRVRSTAAPWVICPVISPLSPAPASAPRSIGT